MEEINFVVVDYFEGKNLDIIIGNIFDILSCQEREAKEKTIEKRLNARFTARASEKTNKVFQQILIGISVFHGFQKLLEFYRVF